MRFRGNFSPKCPSLIFQILSLRLVAFTHSRRERETSCVSCLLYSTVALTSTCISTKRQTGLVRLFMYCCAIYSCPYILLHNIPELYFPGTHILCSTTFCFRESRRLWDNVEKYCGARRVTNDVTIWPIRIACWISKVTCTHAHEHAHAFGHTQERSSTAIMIRERASMLRYCLVINCCSCRMYPYVAAPRQHLHLILTF